MKDLKTTCGMLAAISATALPTASGWAQKSTQPPAQPNVLLIVVDDWGVNDLSMNGSRLYETPNVDRLGEQSNNFSNAYVSYPRSVPSRYSLITGRHCARPQVGAKTDDRKVDATSYCIAQPFKAAGYETFICGKWHLTDGVTMPEDKGFDINIGAGKAGATGTYFAPFNKVKKAGHKTEGDINGMDDAQPGEYLTDYMARKTVDYIQTPRQKSFFAVCSFYAVHTPLEAKQETIGKYKDKVTLLGLSQDPMMPEEAGVRKTQQDHPTYAAMVESVDQAVGDIIAALKATGQYENTLIVLISDHGGLSNRGPSNRELATTNAPLKAGKGHLYEGGIRVPLLIHLPGQQKTFRSDVPVVSYDLLPTLADLCNVPTAPQAELDGLSLKPLLTKKKQPALASRDLFWHKVSERPGSTGDYVSTAIRSGHYKLIDFYKQNRVELYDLATDPGETKNLASSQPALTKELMAKIDTWRKATHVKLDKDNTPEHKEKKAKKQKANKGMDKPVGKEKKH